MSQWRVTKHGILGPDDYYIEHQRLLEMRGELYDWPIHLAEKNWVNIYDFEKAFRAALIKFRKPFDPDILNRSLRAAHYEKVRYG